MAPLRQLGAKMPGWSETTTVGVDWAKVCQVHARCRGRTDDHLRYLQSDISKQGTAGRSLPTIASAS